MRHGLSCSQTHLPISPVCAPCPPPVDTAPARHGDHNCRLLGNKAKRSHYKRRNLKKNTFKNSLKKSWQFDWQDLFPLKNYWIEKRNPFSITFCTEERVCLWGEKKFCLKGLQLLPGKWSQFSLVVAGFKLTPERSWSFCAVSNSSPSVCAAIPHWVRL